MSTREGAVTCPDCGEACAPGSIHACRYRGAVRVPASPPSPAAAPEIDPTIVGVKSVEVEDGRARIKLTVSEQVATMLAGVAFDILESQSAENYVEMLVAHPTTGDFATLTVRRTHRPTPHELRRQAEERARTLQGELEEMREAGSVLDWIEKGEPLRHVWMPDGSVVYLEIRTFVERGTATGPLRVPTLREYVRAALSPKDGDPNE